MIRIFQKCIGMNIDSKSRNKADIGLALSGGAARCIAQLGVLEAFHKMQLPISAISGVSGGAIVAAFYANNYNPREILSIVKETSFIKIMRPAFNIGLLQMKKVEKVLMEYFKINEIENLSIPTTISACNIITGEYVHFTSGNLIKAVVASCSIPLVFKPLRYNNMLLVDGGIINNMEVQSLRKHQIVFGCNVNIIDPDLEINSFALDVERNMDVVVTSNIKDSVKECDLLLEPPEIKKFRLTDIDKADELFKLGYDYALSMEAEIMKVIKP